MRSRRAAFALGTTLALALAACGDDGTGESSTAGAGGPLPVVVDTDGGADDAIALLYLLRRPAVDVVAITVSGTGIVHCDTGVQNVAGLVELASPGADIPVACGPEAPLAGSRAFPDEWREQADERYGGILPAGQAPDVEGDAVDLLVDAVADAERPVTLLTLGPLTNVAAALSASPDIVEGIGEIVVMGGAFHAPGNVYLEDEPAAVSTEWNMYVDPEAAAAVVGSSVPVRFVPLDSQVPVDAYVLRALAENATTPPAHTIAELLASSPFFVSGEFFLWDPLAAAAVAEADAFTTRRDRATVIVDGDEAGRTVAGEGREVEIAVVGDDDAFIARFLGALDGRSEPVELSRVPDTHVTVAEDACRLTEATMSSGPAVVSVGSRGLVAIGTLDPGRTAADVEAYLATQPEGPPEWFPTVALLRATEASTGTAYVDLEPGELSVACIDTETGVARVTGIVELTVAAA